MIESDKGASYKKFAVFGAGFWAQYQLAAWAEVEGVECVALCDRTRAKAERLAERFGIPGVYDDPEELLSQESVDFIDIITDVESHEPLVTLGAKYKKAVICQKPMAPTLAACSRMVQTCAEAGVPFSIHENWRWQTPIRHLDSALRSGVAGRVYRARIDFITAFRVFDNQPFLKSLEQFILTDIGSHILDTARFLFGEPVRLYCQTDRVHKDICGEDVATVVLTTDRGVIVTCNMAYAGTPKENDRFPETSIVVEGELATVELEPNFTIKTTTVDGTSSERCPPKIYPWADPQYGIVHSSIVDCNRDLFAGLNGTKEPETSAADNLRTMELVYGSYASAKAGLAVNLNPPSRSND